MSEKKQWKEREEFSISELEDIWFVNRNLEMARTIILAVKNFQKITLEEKLKFLTDVFHEDSDLQMIKSREKLMKYILSPLLETFLFLLPEWKQEQEQEFAERFTEKMKNGRLILVLLSFESIYPYISVSAGQIKKFVHSYLNSVKKENIDEEWTVEILINNRMFEELVNYNFISNEAIEKLWDFIFIDADHCYNCSSLFWTLSGKPADKRIKRVRELLLSWDKVENRHALATLWTLLTKRGDLEKIFREPQPQPDIPYRDPDPFRISSG